jgi:hypothetical protein
MTHGTQLSGKGLHRHSAYEMLVAFGQVCRSARLAPSERGHCCAISGILGKLPNDVLGCIVAAMLEKCHAHEEVLHTARSVRAFLLTCRGAASAVSHKHRLEALCRSSFRAVCMAPPIASKAHREYTEFAYATVRSAVELQLFHRLLLHGLSHCASMVHSCCRGGRESLNRHVSSETVQLRSPRDGKRWGATLVKQAFGPERETVRTTVAAGSDARLLCQTDTGAAMQSSAKDCVRCVAGRMSDTFSPEGELLVTFETPCQGLVRFAASTGRLLALCIDERNAPIDGRWGEHSYVPKSGSWNVRWDEVEHCTAGGDVLEVWDTVDNVLVCRCPFFRHHNIRALWICGEDVCAFSEEKDEQSFQDIEDVGGVVKRHLHKFSKLQDGKFGNYRQCDLLPATSAEHVSVARHVGSLALFRGNRRGFYFQGSTEFIDQQSFPVVANCYWSLSKYQTSHSTCVGELSPMGDTMVIINRALNACTILIYRRKSVQNFANECQFAEAVRDALGWRQHAVLQRGSWGSKVPASLGDAFPHGAFSPCGCSALFFFCDGHGEGEFVEIDICDSIVNGSVCAHLKGIMLKCVPTKLVWGDGFYLETNCGGGVLRIGSV